MKNDSNPLHAMFSQTNLSSEHSKYSNRSARRNSHAKRTLSDTFGSKNKRRFKKASTLAIIRKNGDIGALNRIDSLAVNLADVNRSRRE